MLVYWPPRNAGLVSRFTTYAKSGENAHVVWIVGGKNPDLPVLFSGV